MTKRAGLGDLALVELDIDLDKEMQRADWTLDPLPKRQLDYAAMDVKVLHPLYEKLWQEVLDTGQERVARDRVQGAPGVRTNEAHRYARR